jgi:PAS domain S-box-containing protein
MTPVSPVSPVNSDVPDWLNTLRTQALLRMLDLDGRLMAVSPAFCQLCGQTADEMLAQAATAAQAASVGLLERGGDAWPDIRQSVVSCQPWRATLSLTAQGRQHWLDTQAWPVPNDTGDVVACLLLQLDVTDARQREDGLRRDKLKAEEASVAKSQFLANMSHDIRTPMNAILGLLHLLQSTALTPRQADYATNTESAARSLLGLINDILDFSKVEAGKLMLDPQPFRVDRLMRDLSVILSANLGTKPVELLFDLDPRMPLALVGDAMRLQQVLINLGGNAVKFTDQGEVVVRMRLVSLQDRQAVIRVAVCDSGIGIDPLHQQTIFDSFSQAELSTTRRFGGTGLGLAISQRFIGLMGSELKLHSHLGQGSEFYFELTLPVAPPEGLDDGLPVLDRTAAMHLKVLLVDDNPTALQLLAELCRSMDWEVDVAASGPQALALIQQPINRAKPYQAIFVDYQMPDMDGWEAVRLIRQREPSPPSHLIMLTAQGRDVWAERSQAERRWLDGFLLKPVTASLLLEAVSHRQGHHSGAAVATAPVRRGMRLMGMRLLVVEDNAINQRIAAELLSTEGASVTVAANGRLGVQAVLDAPRPFDVVLMDLQMPVMDGFAATYELRHTHGLSDLAIVAMTANAMDSDRQACLEAGMNDHVGKPFNMEQLVATLRRHAPSAGGLHAVPQAAADDGRPAWVPAAGTTPAGLDVNAALERLEGDTDLYLKLIAPFLQESTHMLVGLKVSLAKQESSEAYRFVHNLQGMAGTMGALELAVQSSDLAHRIKAFADSVTPADVPEDDILRLERTLATVHNGLHALVLQADNPSLARTPDPAANEASRLRSELARFGDLLRHADLSALGLYQYLQVQHAQDLQPHATALAESINNLDFARAAVLCDDLLARMTDISLLPSQ